MNRLFSSILAVIFANLIAAQEKPPTPDPYAELFGFPSKIMLTEDQKDKLYLLRKEHEGYISSFDASLKTPSKYAGQFQEARDRRARLVVRLKNAILTDEQQKELGIRIIIPHYAQEKMLNDDKFWDLSHLEKAFTIQSRSYDPVEMKISFTVITKTKWTAEDKATDEARWGGAQVLFYNKNEELIFTMNHGVKVGRDDYLQGPLARTPIKLTDKEAEDGLQRFRITLDLDNSLARISEGARGNTASIKFVYAERK